MDDQTFDVVARAVSAGASRRQALRLLASGILGARLSRHAQAAPARQADVCEPGLTYCPGVGDSFVCVVGDCICGGLIYCNGACADVTTDPNNCGGCGIVCDSGVCEAGGCGANVASGCPAGSWDCAGDGNCTSLMDDPNHCGDCGTVCASGICEGGFCSTLGCETGLVACPESIHFGPAGCYDLATDPGRCGSCENACGGAGSRVSQACVEGTCVATGCLEGFVDCTGNLDCVDLMTDPLNCGACGNACASGVCSGGACTGDDMTCATGLTYCPSRQITTGFDNQPYELQSGCFDLSTDNFHCGSCVTTCATTVGCYAGTCGLPPCDAGLWDCAGTCVDLAADAENCGACENVCASGVCDGGMCTDVTTCETGLTFCPEREDGQPAGCYDLSAEYTHCGSCDSRCPIASAGPMACIEGQCQKHCDPPTTLCEHPASIHPDYCADLRSDPENCGTCGNVCATGGCEAGTCTATTLQAAGDASTPTTTPATEETTGEQDASSVPSVGGSTGTQQEVSGAGTSTHATTQPRPTRTPRAVNTTAGPHTDEAAPSADTAVLTWPFDQHAGQWTIMHGYRAEHADPATPVDPAVDDRDFTRLAFAFAVCAPEDIDLVAGTCDLGGAADDPSSDRAATHGSVVSPVDGTVAWTEGVAACLTVGIDIAGHPGSRLALFNVEGTLERGQRVTRGKRIGKVARRGCAQGGQLRMALYQPQPGVSDDPMGGRKGVAFTGDWAIAGCNYPDDGRSVEQFRGELVPCSPADAG